MRRALLVGHQPLREALQRTLEDADYDADSVGTLAEARSVLERGDYDLVMANDRLPDGRGFDAAATAQELGITSFLVSGGADEVTLTPTGKPHLRKQFHAAELSKALAHLAHSE
jgi:DNA-binding response OmpR family regulator